MTSLLRGAFLPVALALIAAAALVVPLPVFVETPREPVSLDERVEVQVDGAAVDGDYLLLAVTMRRGTAARMLQSLLDPARTLVAEARIVPPGEGDEDYFARQRQVFDETATIAAAVGLEAAGYPVDPQTLTGSGVLVVEVVPGTPAEGRIEPGDVIVGVDGLPVRTFDDLRDAIPGEVGASVPVDVERDGQERRVEVVTAELRTAEGTRPGIGVVGQTHEPRIDLPVPVEVDSGRIGGPSAGLMIALVVYDKADPSVDLAAGRAVAGTGRLDQDGVVGSVGGIRQKVAAAEVAGADVLLVPASLADVAESALRPGSALEVLGVATFDDAIEALRRGTPIASPAALA